MWDLVVFVYLMALSYEVHVLHAEIKKLKKAE